MYYCYVLFIFPIRFHNHYQYCSPTKAMWILSAEIIDFIWVMNNSNDNSNINRMNDNNNMNEQAIESNYRTISFRNYMDISRQSFNIPTGIVLSLTLTKRMFFIDFRAY